MQIRCPHCHHPVEVIDEKLLDDVTCPSCGSNISLVSEEATVAYSQGPRRLAHFELLERVGLGGFGAVWKARDTVLDRIVALKVPRRGQLDASEVEFFFRDARAAAQLRHPNIVSVHEVGRDGDSVFIASDFIEGATLHEWLSARPLTVREAAELVAQIADAIQHAHERGVVHRDLKPGNILMDQEGRPHVTDFGMAKRESGEITMTVDGQILGTPAYMSPEQASGKAHEATAASDVYSLGVVLFELLTGELPFRGEKRMLILQILNDEPPSPRKLNGRVPKDLETISLKCLEKEPKQRYQRAGDLGDELRRYLNKEPILARPIGRLERGARWCRRNMAVAGMAALVAIATTLGLIGVSWQWRSAVSSRNRETAARQRAERAETNANRAALNGYDTATESLLFQVRMMRETPRIERPQQLAMGLLSEAGSLLKRANETMRELTTQGIEIPNEKGTNWNERFENLRVEAIRWLTEPRVWRIGTVTIPGSKPEGVPIMGASSDGLRFAVYFSGSKELVVFDRNGALLRQRRLSFSTDATAAQGQNQSIMHGIARTATFSPELTHLVEIANLKPLKIIAHALDTDESVSLPIPPDLSLDSEGVPETLFTFTNVNELELQRPSERIPSVYVVWHLRNGNWVLSQDAEPIRPVRPFFISGVWRYKDKYFPLVNGSQILLGTVGSGSPERCILSLGEREYVEAADEVRISPDAKILALISNERAAIVDMESGAHVDLKWESRRSQLSDHSVMHGQEWISIKNISPLKTGFVALEAVGRRDEVDIRLNRSSSKLWRLGLWEFALPQIPIRRVTTNEPEKRRAFPDVGKPIGSIHMGRDDSLVVAGLLGPAKWKGDERIWNSINRRLSWGAEFGSEVLVATSFPLLETRLISLADGHIVRSMTRNGSERVRGMSRDSMLAVIATDDVDMRDQSTSSTTDYLFDGDDEEDSGQSMESNDRETLTLWSLEENRPIARLGSVRKTIVDDDRESDTSSGTIQFSPDGKWLLIKHGTAIAFWKLPDGKYEGKMTVSANPLYLDFDAGPDRVLASEGMSKKQRLIDMNRRQVLCEFNDDTPSGVIAQAISDKSAVRISGGENGAIYAHTRNINTGQQSDWELGKPIWIESPPKGILNHDQSRLILYGTFGKQEGVEIAEGPGFFRGEVKPRPEHVQLWDLSERKLLREFTTDVTTESSKEWVIFSERNTVTLSNEIHEYDENTRQTRKSIVAHLCWKWADGTDAQDHGTLLYPNSLSGADSNWAVELRDSKITLRNRDSRPEVILDATPLDTSTLSGTGVSLHVAPNDATAVLSVPGEPTGLFSVTSGKQLCSFPRNQGLHTFDSSGSWCATLGPDREIILWDTQTGKAAHRTRLDSSIGGRGLYFQVHPSGKRLAIRAHGSLVLWDVENSRAIQKLDLPAHTQQMTSLAGNDATNLVASGGAEGEILLWNRESGVLIRSIGADTWPIAQVAIAPDGTRLAYSTNTGVIGTLTIDGVRSWMKDLELRKEGFDATQMFYYQRSNTSLVHRLKFHPSGEWLAAAGEDGQLYVLDTPTGELIASIDVDSTPILSMDFSADGTALAMCTAGGRLHLWNLQDESTTRVHAVDSTTADLIFIGGPDLLATAGESIRFWDTKNLVERFQLAELESPIRDIEFSVTTGNLYAAGSGGEINAYNLSSLQDQLDRMGLGLEQRLPSRADNLIPQTGSAWKPVLKRFATQRNNRSPKN